METIHHLKENMKKLRLPGMSDSLELRAKEARENDLGYLEFISFLIQDEILNRESNNLEKRVRTPFFPIRLSAAPSSTDLHRALLKLSRQKGAPTGRKGLFRLLYDLTFSRFRL